MTPTTEFSTENQKRIYALMVLMKTADDRLSKGIGTGEFMCVYWPSRGQEAFAAAMGVSLRSDDQLMHIAKPDKGVMLSTGMVGAELTPTADTMKLEHVADRAAGYAMPALRVDGNDPLAVAATLDQALRRDRTGGAQKSVSRPR